MSFMDLANRVPPSSTSIEYRTFRDASPIHHVSRDGPSPLMHGDADTVVSFKHLEVMEQSLRKAAVKTKLLRVAGCAVPLAGHPLEKVQHGQHALKHCFASGPRSTELLNVCCHSRPRRSWSACSFPRFAPPLEQLPDQIASRLLVTPKVKCAGVGKLAVPVLPTVTCSRRLEDTFSPDRPVAVTVRTMRRWRRCSC